MGNSDLLSATSDAGCYDVDECAVNNGGCSAVVRCINTPGSFYCMPCPAGFYGNPTSPSGCVAYTSSPTAEPASPAAPTPLIPVASPTFAPTLNPTLPGATPVPTFAFTCAGNCDPLAGCTLTANPPFYRCGNCPAGFTGSGATGCVDIDECLSNNGGCDHRTLCINTAGSYYCGACPYGYSGNGATGCVALNPCNSNNGLCSTNPLVTCQQLSVNTVQCGSCPVGYSGSGSLASAQGGCLIVDGCHVNHGGCDPLVTCSMVQGSVSCGACPSGFSGTGIAVGSTAGCHDINECQINNGGCDSRTVCTNTWGSRVCSACPSGYSVSVDTSTIASLGYSTNTCVDVNECLTNNGGCDVLAGCVNTVGSFYCLPCPPGYTGNALVGCVAPLVLTPVVSGSCSLDGVVVAADTNLPVPSARVCLTVTKSDPGNVCNGQLPNCTQPPSTCLTSTSTSGSGLYSFSSLACGQTYTVSAYGSGWVANSKAVLLPCTSSASVYASCAAVRISGVLVALAPLNTDAESLRITLDWGVTGYRITNSSNTNVFGPVDMDLMVFFATDSENCMLFYNRRQCGDAQLQQVVDDRTSTAGVESVLLTRLRNTVYLVAVNLFNIGQVGVSPRPSHPNLYESAARLDFSIGSTRVLSLAVPTSSSADPTYQATAWLAVCIDGSAGIAQGIHLVNHVSVCVRVSFCFLSLRLSLLRCVF